MLKRFSLFLILSLFVGWGAGCNSDRSTSEEFGQNTSAEPEEGAVGAEGQGDLIDLNLTGTEESDFPEQDGTGQVKLEQQFHTEPQILEHQIAAGETLSEIAQAHGTDVETLAWINELNNPNLLRIGQNLTVLTIKGTIHTVVSGDTLAGLARLHQVKEQAIREVNELKGDFLFPGIKLIVPGAKPPARPEFRYALASRDGRPGEEIALIWPLTGRVTSPFGWRTHPVYGTPNFHNGIDIAAVTGTPIKAAADGKVIFSGVKGGYGNTVEIRHADGTVTRYSHNSRNLVSVGQSIAQGQEIARVGATGIVTGPHLDFGVYVNGKAVDPMNYLPR